MLSKKTNIVVKHKSEDNYPCVYVKPFGISQGTFISYVLIITTDS